MSAANRLAQSKHLLFWLVILSGGEAGARDRTTACITETFARVILLQYVRDFVILSGA
jgi:hypothetical protein